MVVRQAGKQAFDAFKKSSAWVWLKKYFLIHQAYMREKDFGDVPTKVTRQLPVIWVTAESEIDDSFKDIWHTPEEARRMIRQGHVVILWRENGENIMYQWLRLNTVDISYLDLKDIEIPRSVGYWSGAYVPPEHSGRMTLRHALASMEELGRQHGYRYSFVVIKKTDAAVNRYHERMLKSKEYQQVTYIKLLWLRCYRVTPTAGGKSRWYFNTSAFWNANSPMLQRACAEAETPPSLAGRASA